MKLIRKGIALALLLGVPNALATTNVDTEAPAATTAPVATTPAGASASVAPVRPHLLGFNLGKTNLHIPIAVTLRGEGVGGYPLDRYGTELGAGGAFAPRARVGLKFDTGSTLSGVLLSAEYEHDVPTGFLQLRDPVDGAGMPESQALEHALRKANIRAQFGNNARVGVGLMTSHWGLGLIANDGARDWEPGSARFTDPRDGDRVLRAFAAVGLHQGLGLVATVAADHVYDDDVLITTREEALPGTGGDQAFQGIASLAIGAGKPVGGGIYAVYRQQTTADGRRLNTAVIDLTARSQFRLAPTVSLTLEGEAALIAGKTTFATTPEFIEQDVLQLGAAARASLDAGRFGGVFDFLYASGDQNPDDSSQNAFRADPNYEMGLFLFRHVIAAQTGRSVRTAGDPELIGKPTPGVDRLPTRGSPTNTIAFFPRAWWRPVDTLEIYGGPLIALSEVPLADPLNSRVAGGEPRNALDGIPGRYLGTELDVGVRWRLVSGPQQLTLGVEGGVLLPGPAFADALGNPMQPVAGARAILDYRL